MSKTRNPDFIKGVDYPLQTYGFSGAQWGKSADTPTANKRPTNAAPMVITSQPPGAFAKNDISWKLTFGASHDSVLSLFRGDKLFNTIVETNSFIGGVYRRAIGNANLNIYEKVDIEGSGIQQIHYLVSQSTASGGRSAISDAGDDLDDIRGIAMRVPMMAAGWGRTTTMRPTDPDPSEDSNKRDNDAAHKLARESWKYAPIDFRYDSRRGVWATWHDLIVDDRNQNLGSWVFSTNPDQSCGFPFLRGKLEDVWRVRRTNRQSSVSKTAAQDDDVSATAEILTHINHQWYDPNNNTTDLIGSVFLIDNVQGASSETCGDETTSNGQLSIYTTTPFFFNDSFKGPIQFTTSGPDDNDLVGEMKFNGSAWVPTVDFDPCRDVGIELGVLFSNDEKLVESISAALSRIENADINVNVTVDVDADGTADSSPLAISALQALEGTAQNTVTTMNDAFNQLVEVINLVLVDLAQQINDCLLELGIDCQAFPTPVTAPSIQGIEVTPVDAPELPLDLDVTATASAGANLEESEDPFEDAEIQNPC